MEFTVVMSLMSAAVGIMTGIFTSRRAWKGDIERQSRETATIISEIGYVKAGIDDIKRRQEKQDERHYSLSARVSKIEASLSAHVM